MGSRLCFAVLVSGVCGALTGCGGSVLHSAPEVIYPTAAAGIEGDVVVETCNSPPSPHVVSGRSEPTAAALEMSAGSWKRPPTSEGTSLENCRQTCFAFRRSPTPSDAAALSAAPDTILIARRLKWAKAVTCPLFRLPDNSGKSFVDGSTDADLTIDESGHVSSVALVESVGGTNETEAIASMKECIFAPATVDGKPFASHVRLKIRWERERRSARGRPTIVRRTTEALTGDLFAVADLHDDDGFG